MIGCCHMSGSRGTLFVKIDSRNFEKKKNNIDVALTHVKQYYASIDKIIFKTEIY